MIVSRCRWSITAIKTPGTTADNTQAMEGRGLIAVFGFKAPTQPLVVKVALSPVSEENAIANMDAEVADFDFDKVHAAATAAWEMELARIDIKAAPGDGEEPYTALVPRAAIAQPEHGRRRELSRAG